MKKPLLYLASVALMASAAAHAATDYVFIPDMSTLQWQINPAGVVFLRNLSSYDSRFLGCCYNYSVDPNTAQGKIIWAAMLTRMSLNQPMYLAFDTGAASPGPVSYAGIW
jgi:hypothetical protein